MNSDNKKSFDFWNDHSMEFLEMAFKRDDQERPSQWDGYGRTSRDCGDTIEIFLIMNRGIIETVSYQIKGCLYSHACTNALITLVKGKTVEQAKKIDKKAICAVLKTLPKAEEHCAVHVLSAFDRALEDYEKKPA